MAIFNRAHSSMRSHQKPVMQAQVVEELPVDSGKDGTSRDEQDMARVGKQQELKRNFRFLSILGFTTTLMCTWEALLSAAAFALIDGGLAGIIWIYVGTFVGFFAVVASMAELSSIAPTSGGQYHWVSEFATPGTQRFLSYMTGWTAILGWQCTTASAAFLAGTQIQGLLILNDASYTFQRWHGTLFVIAISLIATFFNTYGAKHLPTLEGLILLLHIFGFFPIFIFLWVLSPGNSADKVFTEFSNGGGWSSTGVACLIGMISPIYSFIGTDCATHMAEEVKDASVVVPKAMIWTALINGFMGLIMIITFCFCIVDLETTLATPTGFVFIQVFYDISGSKGGATAMSCIIITLIICAAISTLATASRQTYAFARDKGLPFSRFFAHVNRDREVPLNAILLSLTVSIVLALINLGSTAAFNAVVSLSIVSLFASYLFPIVVFLGARYRSAPLLTGRWSLGKAGPAVNIFASLYLTFAIIICFFPTTKDVTPVTMNWSALVFAVVLLWALVSYFIWGRHAYEGPVVQMQRDGTKA